MKVRAKRLGFYGNERRREGSVFEISDAKTDKSGKAKPSVAGMPLAFSSRWMEQVDQATPDVAMKPSGTQPVPGAGIVPGQTLVRQKTAEIKETVSAEGAGAPTGDQEVI